MLILRTKDSVCSRHPQCLVVSRLRTTIIRLTTDTYMYLIINLDTTMDNAVHFFTVFYIHVDSKRNRLKFRRR